MTCCPSCFRWLVSLVSRTARHAAWAPLGYVIGVDSLASGEAPTCIYCGCRLVVPTRPAHVFPEGLGGRLTTIDTVCNDCNNSFSDIEGRICIRLAPFGALAGAMRGDRKPIGAVVEYRGSKWRVENARMDEMAPPPREKGRVQPMPARREDQIRTIAAALKAKKLPPEAMLDGRYTLEPEADIPPLEPIQEDPVDLGLTWGDRISKRVMIKVAIELLAHYDASSAQATELEAARRFARYDEGEEWDFRAGFDTETAAARIEPVAATLVHGIDIWTAGRRVHYRMTLFTELRIAGTLTDSWMGRAFGASYTFDVKDPANRSLVWEPRDGAPLVNKTRRVREREMLGAMQRFEETSLGNSARRRIRAPTPDFNDLYPDVRTLMTKK
jgi:hypothetical protein